MDPLKIKIIISLDKPDKVCVISSDINMILKPACKIRFSDVSGEILRHALPDQKQAAHQREGQEHPGGDPNQVGKEVAHVVLALASQSADKGDAGGVASGGGHEHHVSDDQHLAEIGQAGLTGVVL